MNQEMAFHGVRVQHKHRSLYLWKVQLFGNEVGWGCQGFQASVPCYAGLEKLKLDPVMLR